ncbi:unnamed protein product [Toxocara canis]|uniref:Hydroxysteroid dehydrogenase-like protein 1 n=1 Tax=Toxocara canis TaxID=6265 RepID=A0A183V612_TOXCA|nr:unnamed protein product [Toxocara canis]
MVCDDTICTIGWLALAYILYRACVIFYKIVYTYFIASPINLLEKAGANWAVVTGSTDGIGRAYAHELAQRGFSLLLISRTQSKLDEVKAEIEKDFKVEVNIETFKTKIVFDVVEVKTFVFDFGAGNVETYEKDLVPLLQSMEIGMLGEFLYSLIFVLFIFQRIFYFLKIKHQHIQDCRLRK